MIFYFSCTGNTRWAAKTIAEALNERLVNMADATNDNSLFSMSDAEETVGFCFPVHGWRPPILVRQFIQNMSIEHAQGHFCWALCTAGDDIGLTMEYLNKDLQKKHLRASSVFSLIMPESYVGLPFMDVDKPGKVKEKIQKAGEELQKIIEQIKLRNKGVRKTYRGHWPRINSNLLGEAFVRWLMTDRPFHADKQACIRCGNCVKACPVGNIEGGSGLLPTWKHNDRCLTCFACYHHCPVRAIQFGKRTKGKGQYFFPG